MHDADSNLDHTVELARAEVNRQRPELAIKHLRTIQSEMENMAGSPIWADHQLLFAEALSAKGDPASETEFEEAFRRIRNLSVRSPDLEMRVYEHFADYLVRFAHRLSLARQYFEAAKKVAVECSRQEDPARLQLRIIAIDLRVDEDPQLESFQNLKRASLEMHSTPQEQLAAWILYQGEVNEKARGLMAARHWSVASVDYFRGLLTSVKKDNQ
jgi:hypothetical protein